MEVMAQMAGKNKQPTLTEIRDSLEKQLRDMGADVCHFQAMLDDYICFYKTMKKLKTDIQKNGTTIKAVSAAGKEYDKENPAIKQAAMCNQTMRAILKDMGITTSSCRPPDDDGGGLG